MTDDAIQGVFWLGGGSGAGKSTVAMAVARRLDLRLYAIDGHTYEHMARADARPGEYPRSRALNVLSPEQRMAGTPAELAERFAATSAERLAMVRDDLRNVGDGPAVLVEGPQLFPELVAPLLETTEHGLWLLPTPDFARASVERRFGQEAAANERRYARDVLMTELIRKQAAAHGLPVTEVDGSSGVDASIAAVAGRIAALPGLRRAAGGRERSRIWMAENAVAVRQIVAWWEDAIGRDKLPEGPVFPFSCECETLGCERAVEVAVAEYQRRSADGPVTAHGPVAARA
ncbi:MAG: hypothetical protein ACRDN0_28530 [Trebonia sp.]